MKALDDAPAERFESHTSSVRTLQGMRNRAINAAFLWGKGCHNIRRLAVTAKGSRWPLRNSSPETLAIASVFPLLVVPYYS
jgi:hypothetical protein